jgi:sRNA-binding protein
MRTGKIYPREELVTTIQYLADKYPKAFFTQPALKRPLKRNIVDDLEKDGVLDADRRSAAFSFYTADWNYERALQVGAKRIDLNGKEVGTVTQLEQKEALDRVRIQKEARHEKNRLAGPIEVVRKLHANGKIPTDQLSKITAPALERNVPMVKTKNHDAPQMNGAELTQLRALWGSIDGLLDKAEDSQLQTALAVPALKLFVAEASKLIASIEES